jgi:hypothetical protein
LFDHLLGSGGVGGINSKDVHFECLLEVFFRQLDHRLHLAYTGISDHRGQWSQLLCRRLNDRLNLSERGDIADGQAGFPAQFADFIRNLLLL